MAWLGVFCLTRVGAKRQWNDTEREWWRRGLGDGRGGEAVKASGQCRASVRL